MIGLNGGQQALLFQLRARLLWRQFTGEKGRIVNAIVVLAVFGPMVIGLTVASVIGYWWLPDEWPGQLLGGVLFLLWVVWGVAPIFLGAINVSVNVSRLLTYPVSRRDMTAAVLLGTLLDYPTFLVLPLFGAVVVGWVGSAAWPFVLLGLPIAYLHMVILGQIVMVGAGSILQSRRFRDLSLIVISVLGASCYFISQAVTELLANAVDPEAAEAFFATWRPLNGLRWLPTGAVAQSITDGSAGQWGLAAAWLAYSAVLLVGLGWIWAVLLERLLTGQTLIVGRTANGEKPVDKPKAAAGRWPILSRLPEPLASLVIKELTLIWRIPQRRIGIIQSFLLPFIFGGIYFFSGEVESGFDGRWVGLFLVGYSYLPTLGFGSNTLAWEGQGLSMMFMTPMNRRLIFKGKVLTAAALSALPIAIFVIPLLLIAEPLSLLAGFFLSLGLIGIGTTVSMLFSVWFPFPVNMDPKRPFAQPERRGGFLPTLLSVVGTPLLTGLLGLPLAIPMAMVWWYEWRIAGLVVAIGAAVYGLGMAWYATGPTAEQLMRREPEILAALAAPEGD